MMFGIPVYDIPWAATQSEMHTSRHKRWLNDRKRKEAISNEDFHESSGDDFYEDYEVRGE